MVFGFAWYVTFCYLSLVRQFSDGFVGRCVSVPLGSHFLGCSFLVFPVALRCML